MPSYLTPFYRRFRAAVTWCVRRRWTVIALTVAALARRRGRRCSFVQQQFFPSSDRLEILVDLWLPEGASYEATRAEALKLETLVRKDPDVAHVLTYIGQGAPRFFLALDQQL